MTREELNEEIQQEIEEEEKRTKRNKIIKFVVKMLVVIIVLTFSFYFYTTYVSTAIIRVREYRIKDERIDSSFNGFKIIQFSDLHFGSTMFEKNLNNITKLINERKPDIILFTGDLIAKNYSLSQKEKMALENELKKMSATYGKYAIMGDEDNEESSTLLSESDFMVLNNDSEIIYGDNDSTLLLVGISSIEKNQDINKAYNYFQDDSHNKDIYTIALLHEPDLVDEILENNSTDLFLAGHSHNGNIRIPFLNIAVFKRKGALKYDQDYYEIGKSKLYISSGLGTENGVRLFCRPSINFFRLSNQ